MSTEISRRYICAIFVLALAVRLGYAFVTPPFQAPDEYSHFSYVKFLHTFRNLPVQPNPAINAEELEFHQPPLYYLLAAPLFSSTTLVAGRPLLPMRFINILFSMLTIGVVYFFATAIFQQNRFAVALMCTAVALLPTYSYLSATMQNAVLATFFASLGFHLCAKAVLDNHRRSVAWWSWVGVVAGLAILSKLSSIGFAAAAGFLLLATSSDWRNACQRALWFSLGLASTAGWWFIRNWSVYGQWMKVIENGDGYVPPPVTWAHEKHSAVILFKTFWAVFGRINEFHFADISRLYWWFAAIAVIGMIRYAAQRRSDIPRQLAGFFVLAIAFSLAATMYYAHNYNSDQGRYMFPTLIPIMTFVSMGMSSLFPARFHRLVLDTVLFTSAGINVVVLARLAAIYWQIG